MLIADSSNSRTAYERQFAGQIGAAHAIVFGYARTALAAILSGLGLQPGDEVVLSPLTCKVVPLTLLSLKLMPIYADICADTLNLDGAGIGAKVTRATKAILFQHTYGVAAGVRDAARIAGQIGVPLIEDRAHSLPYMADPLHGIAAVYSNNLLKPLPAASGGVAVTNDATLAGALRHGAARLAAPSTLATARLRMEAWIHRRVLCPELYWPALKLYGRLSPAYRERSPADEIATEITAVAGVPSEYQAREGSRWLRTAANWARQRLESCDDYRRSLASCAGIQLPIDHTRQPLYYFPVRSPHKQAILGEAARRRIEVIAWPKSTPIYPVESASRLRAYGLDPASCPVATALAGELIGLPTHDRMTPARRQKVIGLLREVHG